VDERKTEFLHSHFEMIENRVQFGDHKASLLIAGDAILLAICGGLIKTVSGCPRGNLRVSCMSPSLSLALATIAAVSLIYGLTRGNQWLVHDVELLRERERSSCEDE
jgi:hypothetical protein